MARLHRLSLALVVGCLVGYPGAAISEERAPNRAHPTERSLKDAARSRPMPAIYDASDTTVVPPVPSFSKLPAWHPTQPGSTTNLAGEIELVVAEDGRVVSTSILESVEAHFDGPLLESAKDWTFTPATKAGVPVKFRYIVIIRLVP